MDEHPYNPQCNCDACTDAWCERETERQHRFREAFASKGDNSHDDDDWRHEAEAAEAEADRQRELERHRYQQADVLREVAKMMKAGADPKDIDHLLRGYLSEAMDFHHVERPRLMGDRIAGYTGLRDPVINGIIRVGETMNLVSETKVGKSWMAYGLAICKSLGLPWLERFQMQPGRVLYIDNELHQETTDFRFLEVARAMQASDDWQANVEAVNLRGKLKDINKLGPVFDSYKPGELSLVVIDAGYRALPKDWEENKNGDMTQFYNQIDAYADRLRCAFINVLHSTKGVQGGKRVTDVGAGAGSQSRATDSHVVLRAHEQDDVFVMDAALRSWPRMQPFCLRWDWPCWFQEPNLDPADLRTDRPPKKPKVDTSGILQQQPWTAERFARECASSEPQRSEALLESAAMQGLSDRKASQLFKRAVATGKLHEWRCETDKRVKLFSTIKQPESAE